MPFFGKWEILEPFLRGAQEHPNKALFQKSSRIFNMSLSYDGFYCTMLHIQSTLVLIQVTYLPIPRHNIVTHLQLIPVGSQIFHDITYCGISIVSSQELLELVMHHDCACLNLIKITFRLEISSLNYFWDVGSYTSRGAPSICPRSHGFFFARHVTFWQQTLAARHDCNFNIFCAAPSGHTVGMRHYVLFQYCFTSHLLF